jgi:hypothetical protein
LPYNYWIHEPDIRCNNYLPGLARGLVFGPGAPLPWSMPAKPPDPIPLNACGVISKAIVDEETYIR